MNTFRWLPTITAVLNLFFSFIFLTQLLSPVTSEFFLAAVPHALLQVLQLVFHLFILALRLLTLPPEARQQKGTHMHVSQERGTLLLNCC